MRFLRFFVLIFGLMLLVGSGMLAVGHQQSKEGLWVISFDRVVNDEWFRVEILPNGHLRERPITKFFGISLRSPDNQWRLYTENVERPERLYLERTDRTQSYVLIDNFKGWFNVLWSPDSQWVIFQDNNEQYQRDIHRINIDDRTIIPFGFDGVLIPRQWSADKQWLLVHWFHADNTESLIQVRPDGSEWQAILWKHERIINIYDPQYAANGDWVVFTADGIHEGELYRVSVDGSILEQIETGGWNSRLSVSDNGTWIAFITVPVDSGEISLYRLNVVTTELKLLATNISISRVNFYYPVNFFWSPDGQTIIFYDHGQLVQIDSNSGQITALYQLSTYFATEPSFQPIPTYQWSKRLWIAMGSLMVGIGLLFPIWRRS